MAVIIELSFTDSQWALIEANYIVERPDGEPDFATKITLKSDLERYVEDRVVTEINSKAAQNSANSFNV